MAALTYGWVGKILRVDLTTGKISTVPTGNYAPKFIGGRSMCAKIYWDEVPPDAKALDPENKLIMMTGPEGATCAPNAGRTAIATKSPETIPDCYYYSIPGGHWGPELKFAGYDGIIVQGKSPEPVYLWIHDGEAEIRSAEYLWGKLTSKVDEELQRLHGLQTRTMTIGPAGENLVKNAVIELEGFAAAGMGGFGAVMGAKNLKAIAVRGTGSVKVARPEELIGLREYWDKIHFGFNVGAHFFTAKSPEGLTTHLQDKVAKGTAKQKSAGCWACHTHCQIAMRFSNADVQNGTQTCNDFAELQQDDYFRTGKYMSTDGWEWGRLCDDLGISATNVIGHTVPYFHKSHHGGTWAWQLVEAGLWTEKNTGLPLWSEGKCQVGSKAFNRMLLHKVAYREGIGDLIAEGQQRYLWHVYETAPPELKQAAKDIYDRMIYADKYHVVWQSKHLDMGFIWFLAFCTNVVTSPAATSPVGSKQLAKEIFGHEIAADVFAPELKGAATAYAQNAAVLKDSLTSCFFGDLSFTSSLEHMNMVSKMFSAVTGMDKTWNELQMQVGERTFTLERAILVREGRRREHDTMNDYHFTRARWPEPDGKCVSDWTTREIHNKMLDEYYTVRGWDVTTGIPTRSRLEELDLKDVADDLESKYGVTVQA